MTSRDGYQPLTKVCYFYELSNLKNQQMNHNKLVYFNYLFGIKLPCHSIVHYHGYLEKAFYYIKNRKSNSIFQGTNCSVYRT